MVEIGIVRIYFGRESWSKLRYGFIQVIDEEGDLSGEDVYFHFRRAKRLETLHTYVGGQHVPLPAFSSVRAYPSEPKIGDRIVFEAPMIFSPRRMASSWIYETSWNKYTQKKLDPDPRIKNLGDRQRRVSV